MRRVFLVVIGLALLITGRVWADLSVQGGVVRDDQPIKTLTVTANTNSAGDFAVTSGTKSYLIGFKLLATSADAYCSLYDAATVTGTQIEELSESTADESQVHIWPNPYALGTDLSIGVSNGICIVYYY